MSATIVILIVAAIAIPVAAYGLYLFLKSRNNPKTTALICIFVAECAILVMIPFLGYPINVIVAILVVIGFALLARDAIRVSRGDHQPQHGRDPQQ